MINRLQTWSRKNRRPIVIGAVILLASPLVGFGPFAVGRGGYPRCNGSYFCPVCKNCSRCRHCRNGARCGVCLHGGGGRVSSFGRLPGLPRIPRY